MTGFGRDYSLVAESYIYLHNKLGRLHYKLAGIVVHVALTSLVYRNWEYD